MGAGKSSLVLRFVKGQFFEYQVWPGRQVLYDIRVSLFEHTLTFIRVCHPSTC